MKFAAAYYLLLIYTMVILQPLLPAVEDAVEHCFAEAYHVATVHAVYGNNHLEKETANSSEESNNNNKTVLKDNNACNVHINMPEHEALTATTNPTTNYCIQSLSFINKIALNVIIPPPKYLS